MWLELWRNELQTVMIQPKKTHGAEAMTPRITNWHDPASAGPWGWSCDATNYQLSWSSFSRLMELKLWRHELQTSLVQHHQIPRTGPATLRITNWLVSASEDPWAWSYDVANYQMVWFSFRRPMELDLWRHELQTGMIQPHKTHGA